MRVVAGPVLGLLWALLVLAAAARHRPVPARLRALAPAAERRAGGRHRVDLRLAAGRLALRALRRRAADDVVAARLGGAVLAAGAAAVVVPGTGPASAAVVALAAAAAWWWPVRRRRRAARLRARQIADAVPDVVDLFLLAVDAGLTVPLALRAVGARARDGPLADELRGAVDEIDLGRRTADAIDDLARADRAGDAVRPLTAALVASERYGAPLAVGLARVADDARRARRRRAEEAARRLPVTLLFPLVTCTLPAFGLLTVGPLIASALRSLRL